MGFLGISMVTLLAIGAPTIRFAQQMLCDAPEVLVFTTQVDQGPTKRAVRAAAQQATSDKFDLYSSGPDRKKGTKDDVRIKE